MLAGTWILLSDPSDDEPLAEKATLVVETTTPAMPTTTRAAATGTQPVTTTRLNPSATEPARESSPADLIPSVVFLDSVECERGGSGTIVADGSLVLTNAHVVHSGYAECEPGVWFIDSDEEKVCEFDDDGYGSFSRPPDAVGTVVEINHGLDLAVLRLLDPSTRRPLNAGARGHRPLDIWTTKLEFGEPIFVLGWPGAGGCTITVTRGIYSGMELGDEFDFYKTDATVNHGNSGGAAFDAAGHFIGVPTAGTYAELECGDLGECSVEDIPYGLIRPIKYAVPMITRADSTP